MFLSDSLHSFPSLPPAVGDILVFVHADSQPPAELVRAVRAALARPRVVLGGFTTLMDRPDGRGLLLFHTFHHFVKAYYPVLLLRPLSLVRWGHAPGLP